MIKSKINPISFHMIDFVPALSGLIGKTALVTSFAVVWATQYNIANPDFVFENVRLEMIIGSIITLLAAIWLADTAPSGTLAPLIVLVPSMAAIGVHPFLLGFLSGIIGMIGIKTKIFHKLIALSGLVSKTSLTLTIGISGVLLSLKNLRTFFLKEQLPLYIILASLTVIYMLLRIWKKIWLIVPSSAIISMLVSIMFGIKPSKLDSIALPSFDPTYWWNDMWGIGFGFDLITIVKTLPFAFFILILWAIDTVSITTMLDATYEANEKKEELNLNRSIIITAARNMIGSLFGGAQTSALWRSFLIPLFMVKRPLRPASILLGIFGIIAGFTAVPIKVLSFSPLIWSVLLFGIFIPFTIVGLENLKISGHWTRKLAIIIVSSFGVNYSLVLTWIGAILFELAEKQIQKHKNKVRD